ncbi:MAG TPA: 4Fe-4S binding protein [Armatimonadetes bacterium]|nr:4Fe-4S binding protein [Armatimonadota bacterium]HOM81321.1 ATP-binding protein [Armatimonadota bacterium]HPO72707.1 ATP-binding protein [Armatimonadota bacterium]
MSRPARRSFTLAVAAGKGGTGKTLLATSLALALARADHGPVQIADCDVEEPNADLLLQPEVVRQVPVHVQVPRIDQEACIACGRCAQSCEFGALALIRCKVAFFPALCIGCGTCAFICPAEAIAEEAREVGSIAVGKVGERLSFVQGRVHVGEQRVTPVLQALRRHLAPEGIRILDAPPGTACPMQETIAGSDYCLLVTEPTPFGRSDLGAAVETCRALDVPCGVVVNRAGVGDRSVYDYCEAEGLPLLMEIPWRRSIAEAYAGGSTLVDAGSGWSAALRSLCERVIQIAERR